MKKTDTKSKTYRGQDVLIEKITKIVEEEYNDDTGSAYYMTKIQLWNTVCDRLANDAAEEGLFSTEASILALKEPPNGYCT